MTKFKVGDKVRALETSTLNAVIAGNTYTVAVEQSDERLHIVANEYGVADGWYAKKFTLVEEAPKKRPLAPGDRVVAYGVGLSMGDPVGCSTSRKVGVVTRIDKQGFVELKDPEDNYFLAVYHPKQLRRLKPKAK